MSSKDKILITGASGLLGRQLVRIFCKRGFFTLAHYYSNQPINYSDCLWLKGDFRSLETIREFLTKYQEELENIRYLINNYGPITDKSFKNLTGEDIINDFSLNVLPTFEITRYFLDKSDLKMVVNTLYKGAHMIKGYKNILSYAMAKNSTMMLTESFSLAYPETIFKNAFPPPLKGAMVKGKSRSEISPEDFAQSVFHLIDLG